MKYALVLCALLLAACSNDPNSVWYGPAWQDGLSGLSAGVNSAAQSENEALQYNQRATGQLIQMENGFNAQIGGDPAAYCETTPGAC